MKKLLTLFLALFVVQTLSAQQPEFSAEKKSAVVDNLTTAVQSDNIGLQTSGALVLSNLISGCIGRIDSSNEDVKRR